MADMIKGKTPEEIRKTSNIKNDFIPEDEAKAANYFNTKSLHDLTYETMADMIKGKIPDEIRQTFNIKNFAPEDEEEVHMENACVFE